jgi:hypothetical protein
MLTLAQYIEHSLLQPWNPPGEALPLRNFYYTARWEQQFNALHETARTLGLRRITNRHDWVRGFVDAFVCGTPYAQLVRPTGFAMDPPFQRMRHPNTALVEMSTEHTRTFGFFHCHATFVADRIVLTETVKAGRNSVDAEYKRHASEILGGWVGRLKPGQIDGDSDVQDLF